MKKKASNISIGNINNSTGGQINISGGDIFQENFIGQDADEIVRVFNQIYKQINAKQNLSNNDKTKIKSNIKEFQKELRQGKKADSEFLARRLQNIKRMAPDIVDVVIALLSNKALGLTVVAKKISEKIKADTL